MKRRYQYPARTDLVTTFYSLYIRFLKLAPISVLLVMLLLLVGFSVTTGYLLMERKAKSPLTPIPMAVSHPAVPCPNQTPPANAAIALSSGPAVINLSRAGENTTQHFAIALGAYVYKTTFEDEQQLAERLEQPFHVKIGEKRVTTTRLYLGTYPAKKAAAILKKIQKIAPDAFLVSKGEGKMASVYGGSYYYRGDVEKTQTLLTQKGFATKQVPTRETLPIYSVYLGDFESQDKAVEFIRTAGLSETDMPVVAIN